MTPPDAPDAPRDLLDEIEQALQQATPGPWMRGSRRGTYCTEITSADCGREIAAVWNYADAFAPGELRPVQQLSAQGEADFALMQHAPEWLGALVQRVRTAERAPILVCESCGTVDSAECHYCAGVVGASRPGEPQP